MRVEGQFCGQAASALLAALVALTACSGSTAQERPEDPIGTARLEHEKTQSTPFDAALSRAIQQPEETYYVRIFTRCITESGEFEQVEIFGNGVSIWDGGSQFRFPAYFIPAFVHLIREAGFAEMPASFGGQPDHRLTPATSDPSAPLRILCEVEVEIDGERKRVEQLSKGERSQDLLNLGREILSRCRMRSVLGVRARDLHDGLTKVSESELAGETFRMTFTEKPELSQPDSDGLSLSIRGRRMTARRHTRASGLEAPIEIELSSVRFADLIRQLAIRRVDAMPANLFATEYVDLNVEVLNHRTSIQARQFAGLEADTHGEMQQEFDKLLEVIRALLPAETTASPTDPPPDRR